MGRGKELADSVNRRDLRRDRGAPGLIQQPTYLVASTFVEVDYRQPLNARRGGWYRIEFSRYDDRDLDAYSFNRVDVDLRQFVPFLAERRVIALRALRLDVRCGRRPGRAVLPDAVPRRQRYAARVPRVSLPRSARLLLQAEYR